MAVPVTDLAARLPDVPRLVETRAILLSGTCEVRGDAPAGHYVVRSLDAAIAAVVGRPSPQALRDVAQRGGVVDILCAEDAVPAVCAALPGWHAEAAAIHVLGQAASARARSGAGARLVGADEALPLAHVPSALREEVEAARGRSPFAMAFANGRAVSFAYVPWQTETLCDLSVDTLAGHRRAGRAFATASVLIDHLRGLGKQPVWGALETNTASLRLAARLGFVPVDRLFVFTRG